MQDKHTHTELFNWKSIQMPVLNMFFENAIQKKTSPKQNTHMDRMERENNFRKQDFYSHHSMCVCVCLIIYSPLYSLISIAYLVFFLFAPIIIIIIVVVHFKTKKKIIYSSIYFLSLLFHCFVFHFGCLFGISISRTLKYKLSVCMYMICTVDLNILNLFSSYIDR